MRAARDSCKCQDAHAGGPRPGRTGAAVGHAGGGDGHAVSAPYVALTQRLAWDDQLLLEAATGRRALTDQDRMILGPLQERFPLLS